MKVRGHSNSNIRLILRAIPGFVEGESRSVVAIVLDAFLASLTRTVSSFYASSLSRSLMPVFV